MIGGHPETEKKRIGFGLWQSTCAANIVVFFVLAANFLGLGFLLFLDEYFFSIYLIW
jgi:hypothetical protein